MTSYLEDLERLGRLRDQRVLSDEEFEAEKVRILNAHNIAGSNPPDWRSKLTRPVVWGPIAAMCLLGFAAFFGITSATGAGSLADNGQDAPRKLPQTPSSDVRLSSILNFTVPSQCEPGEELKVLIDDMRSLEPGASKSTPGLSVGDATVRPLVQRIAMKAGRSATISQLSAPGSLAGLKVTGIRTSRFDGSQLFTTQIRFAESPDKVLRVLNGEGFDLSKVGDLKTVEVENGALMMGVEGIAGGSALTCARA